MKYQFIITGRRWLQRSYGNTYHTATMEVRDMDGNTVYTYKSGERYGYGEQFIVTAMEYFIAAGYLPEAARTQCITTFCRDNGYPAPIINTIDVTREKDL